MTGTPTGMEAFSIEAGVRGGPLAASRARRFMRQQLDGRIPEHLMTDVALLLTELVANGVRHGGADDAAQLRIRFLGRPPMLRVEVQNPDHKPGRVTMRPPDPDVGGGFGLHIVERVASRWGVREQPRTAVWFELDCDADTLL